jgi:hypothetical protein
MTTALFVPSGSTGSRIDFGPLCVMTGQTRDMIREINAIYFIYFSFQVEKRRRNEESGGKECGLKINDLVFCSLPLRSDINADNIECWRKLQLNRDPMEMVNE